MKRVSYLSVLCFCWMALGWSQTSQAELKLVAKIKKAHCQYPRWSKNGAKLSYEVRHVSRSIIEIRIHKWGSSGKHTVVNPAALQSGGLGLGVHVEKRGMVAREVSWSPKGNKYLFSSNGTGTVYNVYLSGSGPLKLNSRLKNDGQPAWSKNGKYVAFTSGRTGNGDIYYTRMSGTLKARRLTKFGNSTELFPTWSPKSNLSLAYIRHTEQSDRIYIVKNVFIRKSKRLTKWRKNLSELNPSWSPDGQHIAFFGQYSDGRYDLFVTKVASGKTTRLARNVVKGDQYGPAWAPNGKHIFYVQKKSQNRDVIMAVNVSTKAKKNIKTGTVVNNEISVASRGGKWLLAFTSQGTSRSTGLVYRKLFVKTLSPF
ncbi:MAG: hypothetical protein EP343_30895 [Deltaproteobacteria bacterium]|nr:MAG: hypothetical protein EP343_30895 [Deltaproteobacteria bacterium]